MSAPEHRENDWQRICLSALICHTYKEKKRPPDKRRSMVSPNNKITGNKSANIFLIVVLSWNSDFTFSYQVEIRRQFGEHRRQTHFFNNRKYMSCGGYEAGAEEDLFNRFRHVPSSGESNKRLRNK